ncbi:MAG: TniQ family protein [Chloroflexi bacterium]|nr:TniQ family protein [Chloroflexota bacterium]
MALDMLTTYQLWDLTRPAIPPRSRLYHLEPVGIGTPYVESLTGYIARLAQVHGVTTRKLVTSELLPLLQPSHPLGVRGYEANNFWTRDNRFLNGTGSLARGTVRALETLTLRGELRFLTMLTWATVLSTMGLIRRNRAWCPACYEEWHRAGQIVYEPLLWSLAPVAACLRHHRRLRQSCQYDSYQQPSLPLTSRSRPGHCGRCGRWLGISPEEEAVSGEALTEDELRSQAWIVQALGELLVAAPRLPAPPERRWVAQAITACAEQTSGGRAKGMARKLGLKANTLLDWRSGLKTPCLWLLLSLCHRLGVTPLQILTNDVRVLAPVVANVPELEQPLRRSMAGRKPLDVAEAQRALEAVLADDEFPPPSIREVADRLGRPDTLLRHRLPELCRPISARHLDYRKELRRQRTKRLCAEVRKAVWTIHAQGLYPSARRVALLLSQPGSIRDPAARDTWQASLHELGWRT